LLILVAAPVNARSDADQRAAKRVEAMASFLAAYARGQGAVIDAELRVGQRVGPFVVIAVPGNRRGRSRSIARSGAG
jgi:hypothetical protein